MQGINIIIYIEVFKQKKRPQKCWTQDLIQDI